MAKTLTVLALLVACSHDLVGDAGTCPPSLPSGEPPPCSTLELVEKTVCVCSGPAPDAGADGGEPRD